MNANDIFKDFKEILYTGCKTDEDKFTRLACFGIDILSFIGTVSVVKSILNRYAESKGLLKKIGILAIGVSIAGRYHLDVSDRHLKYLRRKEQKDNGTDKSTREYHYDYNKRSAEVTEHR